MTDQRLRLQLVEAALRLFAQHGYASTHLRDVSEAAGVTLGAVCSVFPTKEHLALAIYARLAVAFSESVVELPAGTVAERFSAAMARKLSLLQPHRRALIALSGKALDPDARAGVFGESAEPIRSRVTGVFAAVVRGATDVPPDPMSLTRTLYAAHLALILLWTQRNDVGAIVALAGDVGRWLPMFVAMAPPAVAARVEGLLGDRLPGHHGDHEATARVILGRIFRRRRVHSDVDGPPSEAAHAVHLPRVLDFLRRQEPIQLVLPAFPAKAPNPDKVLGPRPDAAERLALRGLCALLDEIEQAHPPGAELVICSDGAVFADTVRVSDEDVRRYRTDLEEMLRRMGETRIRMFGLSDAFGARPPDAARALLLDGFAQSVASIRERAQRSEVHRRQLDGIHRFLVEDEVGLRDGRSKSAIRRQTRERAYEVVRRSDAWGGLVAAVFPRGLRLSIHPQPDVSSKIGIHMLATQDAWLTPWHGCAVLRGGQFELSKRARFPSARVVEEDGRPSYLLCTAEDESP